MECHDARLLLTFAQRKSESLDPTEQSALQQHLERCPDCGTIAQVERHADETLSRLMLDVPVPADLKSKIMSRMAAERPGNPWKPLALATVAVLFLAVGGAVLWCLRPSPRVTSEDIGRIISGAQSDEATVEARLQSQGLTIVSPRLLDHRYFQHADVVEFQGRRVAKLTFVREHPAATASVLVLPKAQFRMDAEKDLREQDIPNTWIRHSACREYIYVILYRGDIHQITREIRN